MNIPSACCLLSATRYYLYIGSFYYIVYRTTHFRIINNIWIVYYSYNEWYHIAMLIAYLHAIRYATFINNTRLYILYKMIFNLCKPKNKKRKSTLFLFSIQYSVQMTIILHTNRMTTFFSFNFNFAQQTWVSSIYLS